MSYQDQAETPDDVLDLDALEAEASEKKKPPYPFKLGGKVYHLVNAEDLDYRDLLAAFRAANTGDFEITMRLLLPEDERDAFFENDVTARTLGEMFERYTKHFGLTQGKGSKRSSRS